MSNLNRLERASAQRQRALRRAEREDMLRVVGTDEEMETPDAAVIAASSRDPKANDPRSGF